MANLAVLDERPVRLEDDEAAVHVLQEEELALENVIRAVGKVLLRVGVRELVLDHRRARVDETRVGDDAELLHLMVEHFLLIKSLSATQQHLSANPATLH